jgi:two-component system sensor histidine kinase ChvG
MVRRLAEPAGVRARLFGVDGTLLADSRLLMGPRGTIKIETLPAPGEGGAMEWLRRLHDRAVDWLQDDRSLPVYEERSIQTAGDYPEVLSALSGEQAGALRTRAAGGLMLSGAVPVQRYKQVVGAVMLTSSGDRIDGTLFEIRMAILQLFAFALAITVGVSIYLAGTIARPLRRLAVAAERVRTGQARRHTIPDLSRRGDEIGELSRALREMTEALWHRMDAVEAFAADVAHEIKNPLTSLRSAVETATLIKDPERQRKLMTIIQDDVARLDRLISDISDASRLDAELSRAESEPVAVRRMVETLVDVYRSTSDNGPAFTIDAPADDDLMVHGMEGRLVQVFRNLIGNAMSFSPPGGTIHLTCRHEDGTVAVTVEDDGPGIPANKLEAIFERFYSERPEGEKFGTHSGLGLSISKQIIEALHGTIRAENRLGADGAVLGARFVVRLPAV